MNNQPLNLPGVSAETLAIANAARIAFGHAPYSEKAPQTPFTWPIKAIPLFTQAELNMMVGVISDCHGFKTPKEKAPAHMTAVLIGSRPHQQGRILGGDDLGHHVDGCRRCAT